MSAKHFTHGNYRVTWSHGNIESEHKPIVESRQDIAFFHYMLTVEKLNPVTWERHNLVSVTTYEFPALITFEAMLKEALDAKAEPECQREILTDQSIRFTRMTSSQYVMTEDLYTITKEMVPRFHLEKFHIFIGGNEDVQSEDAAGVVLTLNREEVTRLYITVRSFINEAIKEHNEVAEKILSLSNSNRPCKINGQIIKGGIPGGIGCAVTKEKKENLRRRIEKERLEEAKENENE